mmetsp:Transcript_27592/g.90257  ORF Transcript_27592/g.90257 Transcript_27592/m.90257 type:complete len:332 (+) Transcript_27592:1132-2127(+)
MERRAEHEHLQAVRPRARLGEALEELHDGVLVPRVEQAVSLVEHEEAHLREVELAALHKVDDAPRRPRHDVHAVAERAHLRPSVHAAHEERGQQLRLIEVLAVVRDAVGGLLREVARGLEDERLRQPAPLFPLERERRHHLVGGGVRDGVEPLREVLEGVPGAEVEGGLRVLEAERREDGLGGEVGRNGEGYAERDSVLGVGDGARIAVQETTYHVVEAVRLAVAVKLARVRLFARAAETPPLLVRAEVQRSSLRRPTHAHQTLVRDAHLVIVPSRQRTKRAPPPSPEALVPSLSLQPILAHCQQRIAVLRTHLHVSRSLRRRLRRSSSPH